MSAETESGAQKSYALAIKNRREEYASIREQARKARSNSEDTSQLEERAQTLNEEIQYYMEQLAGMGLNPTEIEQLIELI